MTLKLKNAFTEKEYAKRIMAQTQAFGDMFAADGLDRLLGLRFRHDKLLSSEWIPDRIVSVAFSTPKHCLTQIRYQPDPALAIAAIYRDAAGIAVQKIRDAVDSAESEDSAHYLAVSEKPSDFFGVWSIHVDGEIFTLKCKATLRLQNKSVSGI